MAIEDQSPFALEEPEWLKDTEQPHKAALVGGAELPAVEEAFDALESAVDDVVDVLEAGIADGGAVETMARLLAALQAVKQVEIGLLAVQTALWYSPLEIRVTVQEEDNPFR